MDEDIDLKYNNSKNNNNDNGNSDVNDDDEYDSSSSSSSSLNPNSKRKENKILEKLKLKAQQYFKCNDCNKVFKGRPQITHLCGHNKKKKIRTIDIKVCSLYNGMFCL